MYRNDAKRSGVTKETLSFPLHRAWEYRPIHPPQPAWPEPGRELHRMDFDYAFQPVAAGGLVFFGSSSDDTIRALDARTGSIKWHFITSGPVRFAPAVSDGKVYAASDDEHVYCLNATDGKLIWNFRGAPGNGQIIGNGRMISRWPVRTGVLIMKGIVYFTVGMWPSEGIYIYALDAETGKIIWCTQRGVRYREQPHGGASAFTAMAPQGYLAASGKVLLVPTGRSVPAAFDITSGEFLYYWQARMQRNGGCWVSIEEDLFFNPRHGSGPNRDTIVGESPPQEGDGLAGYLLATGRQVLTISDRHRMVTSRGIMYTAGNGRLEAVEIRALREQKPGTEHLKWSVKHPRA